jgi:hypothetical protein
LIGIGIRNDLQCRVFRENSLTYTGYSVPTLNELSLATLFHAEIIAAVNTVGKFDDGAAVITF